MLTIAWIAVGALLVAWTAETAAFVFSYRRVVGGGCTLRNAGGDLAQERAPALPPPQRPAVSAQPRAALPRHRRRAPVR